MSGKDDGALVVKSFRLLNWRRTDRRGAVAFTVVYFLAIPTVMLLFSWVQESSTEIVREQAAQREDLRSLSLIERADLLFSEIGENAVIPPLCANPIGASEFEDCYEIAEPPRGMTFWWQPGLENRTTKEINLYFEDGYLVERDARFPFLFCLLQRQDGSATDPPFGLVCLSWVPPLTELVELADLDDIPNYPSGQGFEALPGRWAAAAPTEIVDLIDRVYSSNEPNEPNEYAGLEGIGLSNAINSFRTRPLNDPEGNDVGGSLRFTFYSFVANTFNLLAPVFDPTPYLTIDLEGIAGVRVKIRGGTVPVPLDDQGDPLPLQGAFAISGRVANATMCAASAIEERWMNNPSWQSRCLLWVGEFESLTYLSETSMLAPQNVIQGIEIEFCDTRSLDLSVSADDSDISHGWYSREGRGDCLDAFDLVDRYGNPDATNPYAHKYEIVF